MPSKDKTFIAGLVCFIVSFAVLVVEACIVYSCSVSHPEIWLAGDIAGMVGILVGWHLMSKGAENEQD